MVEFLFKIMFITDLLLIGFILTARMPKRDHFPLRAATAVVACIAASLIWTNVSSNMDIIGNVLDSTLNYVLMSSVAAAGLCFCIQFSGWSAVFLGTSMWLLQNITSSLDFLIPTPHGMNLQSWLMHVGLIAVVALISWLLYYRRVEASVLDRMDMTKAVPSWILMCIVCVMLSSLAETREESNLSFKLMSLVCTLILFLYQRSIYIICGDQREQDAISQVLRLSRHQYAATRDQMEMINIKAHDLKHQIHGFRKNGQIDEKVLKEMERAVDSYDTQARTGNAALDVMLTEKQAACLSRGITLTCMADGSGLNYMEAGDLYALFGNALDNAIEAVEDLPDPAKKQISLTINRRGDMEAACIMNVVEREVTVVNGIPQTTKKDKTNHGFGMKSMQLIAEKYGGSLTFHMEDQVAELDILLPSKETPEKSKVS